ncbi:hypothetical protein AB0M29_43545 [Streptomyces sp. NPDC051976]|uniref:hypothetical protein n=1 Tax=Streptomyces sp. NPDC051976 TaxID=3154947 RepID=UPI003439F5D6
MDWRSRLRVRQAEGDRFLWQRKAAAGIDASYGDPRRAAVRAAGRDGVEGWPGIRAVLAEAADDEDLTFLVQGLESVPGVERWSEQVLTATPGDPLALLVSGARLARTAPGDGARRRLSEAAALEPSWAAPWYFLQVAALGRGESPEAAEPLFHEVCDRVPWHTAAHRQRLQHLCAKSGGSHARTHAFAREAMLAAPEGSPLGGLVAMAHIEEWLALGGDPESLHMTGPPVVHALREAAARSVGHPAFVRRRDWAVEFNTFAMAFALAGDHRSARPLFRALGARATEFPWRYLDERSPLVAFRAWRSRVNR